MLNYDVEQRIQPIDLAVQILLNAKELKENQPNTQKNKINTPQNNPPPLPQGLPPLPPQAHRTPHQTSVGGPPHGPPPHGPPLQGVPPQGVPQYGGPQPVQQQFLMVPGQDRQLTPSLGSSVGMGVNSMSLGANNVAIPVPNYQYSYIGPNNQSLLSANTLHNKLRVIQKINETPIQQQQSQGITSNMISQPQSYLNSQQQSIQTSLQHHNHQNYQNGAQNSQEGYQGRRIIVQNHQQVPNHPQIQYLHQQIERQRMQNGSIGSHTAEEYQVEGHRESTRINGSPINNNYIIAGGHQAQPKPISAPYPQTNSNFPPQTAFVSQQPNPPAPMVQASNHPIFAQKPTSAVFSAPQKPFSPPVQSLNKPHSPSFSIKSEIPSQQRNLQSRGLYSQSTSYVPQFTSSSTGNSNGFSRPLTEDSKFQMSFTEKFATSTSSKNNNGFQMENNQLRNDMDQYQPNKNTNGYDFLGDQYRLTKQTSTDYDPLGDKKVPEYQSSGKYGTSGVPEYQSKYNLASDSSTGVRGVGGAGVLSSRNAVDENGETLQQRVDRILKISRSLQ